MADLYALLANCVLECQELRFRAGGFDIELHQLPNETELREMRGHPWETTELFVRDVAEGDVPTLLDWINDGGVISRVCEMLSFATESNVMVLNYSHPVGNMRGRRPPVGDVQKWKAPFQQSGDVKRFLETCFDAYVRLRDPRKLNVVVDYLRHTVMAGLAEEVKIALSCVVFENLKHHWALDHGYGEKHNQTLRWLGAPGAAPGDGTFAGFLTLMFEEVSMPDLIGPPPTCTRIQRITAVRNSVIHTGLYNLEGDPLDFLQEALREYFLRLLGYKGAYMGYEAPHWRTLS